MASTSFPALRTQNLWSHQWGWPVALCPMSPLQSWLVSSTEGVDNIFMEWFGLEETSGGSLPAGESSLLLRTVSALNWEQVAQQSNSMGLWKSWQHSLAVSGTSLRRIAQLHSGVERAMSIFVPYFTPCQCTVLKQPFIFLNSSAPQNLHLWERTAEEEKITRRVLNASSPK